MIKKQQTNVIQFHPKKKSMIASGIGVVLVIFFVVLMTCFHITEIEVTGNVHYTKEEIVSYVKSQGYVDNTVLFMLKKRFSPIKNVPFVAKMDVEYVNAHKVTVTVYEKALAGCVEYMNEYVYFDLDGYVLEISPKKIPDAPCIEGMQFSSMELHEKLPISDKKRFKLILKLTQQLQKNDLQVESIRFTSENEIVMQYENIRIELGDGSNLEEQLTDLARILDSLKGKKGVLNMRDFDTASGTASFKMEREEPKKETAGEEQEKEEENGTSTEENNPENEE